MSGLSVCDCGEEEGGIMLSIEQRLLLYVLGLTSFRIISFSKESVKHEKDFSFF